LTSSTNFFNGVLSTLLIKFIEEKQAFDSALVVEFMQAFCHFLVLIQESNQRKSRKNNASTR
jgi:hypothetical protein